MFESGGRLSAVGDDELSVLLCEASAEVNRAQVRRLAVAAEWDRRQAWAKDGAYNGRCWLADRCDLSRAEAGRVLRTADVLSSAPVIAAAVADGTLPVAKAEVFTAVVTARTAEAFVRDQEKILEGVVRLDVDHTRRLAQWWQRLADQDGAEPAVPNNRLRCTVAGDGTTHIAAVLDAEGGSQVRNVLECLADQLWRAEREDDDQPKPVGCNERLRAEALVEMARLATVADPTRTGARPLISVIVDLATLEARADRPAVVEGGGTISAEDARRLACDADLSRVITDPDGAILELGRTARTATPDMWRLLRLRDKGCTWPGCDRPPSWCQAHHITWWGHGGRTDAAEMTLLCNHHHHRIHDGGWNLERLDDGSLRFTGPRRADPQPTTAAATLADATTTTQDRPPRPRRHPTTPTRPHPHQLAGESFQAVPV